MPRFYLVSRRKPCWNAPGNWNFFSKPSKETVITPFSMVVTFPVPKAWCVTMEPGLYSRCRRPPPRMRGRGAANALVKNFGRITPAYAGKRPWGCSPRRRQRDHPRVRGEELKRWRPRRAALGSPPRARGRVADELTTRHLSGITPACAGKSIHPGDGILCLLGSPPRARGRAGIAFPLAQALRITPACAGKSLPEEHITIAVQDHPRVRGEERIGDVVSHNGQGSPPRTRG